MPIPVHVICGKCGSLDIRIKVYKEEGLEPCFSCNDCAELTSVDTVNAWKEEQFPSLKKKSKKV